MGSEHVRVFQTMPHGCGYFSERVARNEVIDPTDPRLASMYPDALAHGFRRSGSHLYRPRCLECQACTPCRVPVAHFQPDRSQRRCRKRNSELQVTVTEPGYTPERHTLYRRYLPARHAGGGMDAARASDFSEFLTCGWSRTRFLELRLADQLLAVAVTDVCRDGLSAVYTFFDPDYARRSLGTFAILTQISQATRQSLAYVYLGYWIDAHPGMDYKRRFRPIEVLRDGQWQVLPEA